MKGKLFIACIALLLMSCGDSSAPKTAGTEKATTDGSSSYDPNRGEGKFSKVEVTPSLDVAKATSGEKVYGVKCGSCHKLSNEKLVGPGWQGVTSRHTAEWIMNFATNPDPMITKDPKAQAMLEICLVRMPNQNVSDDDARNVYEFMRKNDGVK
ncbi:MAG: c-type cytochrome [Bacteroidota bacterium]